MSDTSHPTSQPHTQPTHAQVDEVVDTIVTSLSKFGAALHPGPKVRAQRRQMHRPPRRRALRCPNCQRHPALHAVPCLAPLHGALHRLPPPRPPPPLARPCLAAHAGSGCVWRGDQGAHGAGGHVCCGQQVGWDVAGWWGVWLGRMTALRPAPCTCTGGHLRRTASPRPAAPASPRRYGDWLRNGWRNVVDVVLRLHRLDLLPPAVIAGTWEAGAGLQDGRACCWACCWPALHPRGAARTVASPCAPPAMRSEPPALPARSQAMARTWRRRRRPCRAPRPAARPRAPAAPSSPAPSPPSSPSKGRTA